MERKLAHIEKIETLSPIIGADKIEVAQVLGWQCVVKKGEFKVGDAVIYVEVDSIMPPTPEFEFLRERKFRIKTIKLKGQISQGLVLPLEGDIEKKYHLGKLTIGDDVTDILGIQKYLTPTEKEEVSREAIEKNRLKKYLRRYSFFRRLFSQKKKSKFPYWVVKTDEERIQNMPNVLLTHKEVDVYITEKIDYQSVTFTSKLLPRFGGFLGTLLPKKHFFAVCSRNLQVFNKNSLYWTIANKYKIEQILKKYPNLTIQGEQGDTNVQGNKYKLSEPKMWVFNIIDHAKRYHYDYDEMLKFCNDNGLDVVPLLRKCKLSDIGTSVPEVVEFSKGKSVLADIPREGVVIRCIKNGQKILSFKAINPDFLLKYDS